MINPNYLHLEGGGNASEGCPRRLALVILLQFAENLSDRRAAEAVRGRIDWKYLLGLDQIDPSFEASVLSEFRGCPVAGCAEEQVLRLQWSKPSSRP